MEDFELRIPQPGEHYAHYKGGRYEVLAVGRLSEKRDELVVTYRSLERGHVWVRPLGMWGEYLDVPAAALGKPPERVQRFRLCEDSPPSTVAVPLTEEEAQALDRELLELVPGESATPLERQQCQHLRAGTLTKLITVRVSTVPDAENKTTYKYRMSVDLCVFCAVYALGPITTLLRGEPMLCTEDPAMTTLAPQCGK